MPVVLPPPPPIDDAFLYSTLPVVEFLVSICVFVSPFVGMVYLGERAKLKKEDKDA